MRQCSPADPDDALTLTCFAAETFWKANDPFRCNLNIKWDLSAEIYRNKYQDQALNISHFARCLHFASRLGRRPVIQPVIQRNRHRTYLCRNGNRRCHFETSDVQKLNTSRASHQQALHQCILLPSGGNIARGNIARGNNTSLTSEQGKWRASPCQTTGEVGLLYSHITTHSQTHSSFDIIRVKTSEIRFNTG
jgi:hypothetical protein